MYSLLLVIWLPGEARSKWPPSCRRHFRRISCKIKICILLRISLRFVPRRTHDNKSSVVQVLSLRRTSGKKLPKPLTTQLTQGYMRHKGYICLQKGCFTFNASVRWNRSEHTAPFLNSMVWSHPRRIREIYFMADFMLILLRLWNCCVCNATIYAVWSAMCFLGRAMASLKLNFILQANNQLWIQLLKWKGVSWNSICMSMGIFCACLWKYNVTALRDRVRNDHDWILHKTCLT